jgi:hypothetical protein
MMNRRTFVKSLAAVVALEGPFFGLLDSSKKICPFCRDQGLKSSVYMEGCQTTLLATYAYWDENGTYHYHNPNKTSCQYRCSNGHEWSE